jgi:hypothetical protein
MRARGGQSIGLRRVGGALIMCMREKYWLSKDVQAGDEGNVDSAVPEFALLSERNVICGCIWEDIREWDICSINGCATMSVSGCSRSASIVDWAQWVNLLGGQKSENKHYDPRDHFKRT